MRLAGLSTLGRISARMAGLFAPPYVERSYLARLTDRSYIHPRAVIHHDSLDISKHCFIDDRVVIYQAKGGGRVVLGNGSSIFRDGIIETGQGGSVTIGAECSLHSRCQVMAHEGSIIIGDHATVAPACAFYAYNHSFEAGVLPKKQALRTHGGIRIGVGVWLGYGVIVLDGVHIGDGAVIGAGSVVSSSIPANAIAVGMPARVVAYR